jgi:hypothetical protein
MLAEALTFATASLLHFGTTLSLGFATIHDPFRGAAVPEAIIAAALVGGAIVVLAAPRGSWGLALTTTLFAVAGVIIGLSFILSGPVSRPGDLIYHGLILVALLATLGLEVTTPVRTALRKAALR